MARKHVKKGKRKEPALMTPWQWARKFRKGVPLVGDFASSAEEPGNIEMLRYKYANEPIGLEDEGIMGIPTWAILLGGIVAIGGYLYLKNKSAETTVTKLGGAQPAINVIG
jgi:hypothetical protein